jgi:dolichol-phosphate mannosyltransferase
MIELSIILPVYNERQTLPILLAEWSHTLHTLGIEFEFVICEDGSNDGTKELLPGLQKIYPIQLNQSFNRRGYGGAVLEGISIAHGNWILCIDSDGQCDPKDLNVFWNKRENNSVLIGWRNQRKDVLMRKIMSRLFGALFTILFPRNAIHDPSAPFVLFQKSTISPYIRTDLSKMKEGFWWGFVAVCHIRSISIKENIVNHRVRVHGKTQVYRLSKIPSIVIRNIMGLLSIRYGTRSG